MRFEVANNNNLPQTRAGRASGGAEAEAEDC